MLTGESPFYGTHDEIEEDIIAVNYKIPAAVPEGARDLIKRLLKRGTPSLLVVDCHPPLVFSLLNNLKDCGYLSRILKGIYRRNR